MPVAQGYTNTTNDWTIVPALAGHSVHVLGLHMEAAASGVVINVYTGPSATGTLLWALSMTSPLSMVSRPSSGNPTDGYILATDAGEALTFDPQAATVCNYSVEYEYVPA